MSCASSTNRESAMHVYFFTGHNMAPKRYHSYFTFLRDSVMTYNATDKPSDGPFIILCHSAGLLKAWLWCRKHTVAPICMIAFDPPYFDMKHVQEKIETYRTANELSLCELYQRFQTEFINDFPCVRLHIFRPQSKADYRELEHTNNCVYEYYQEETHYPYMLKHVLQMVRKLLNPT
jgi:hypothetical protein